MDDVTVADLARAVLAEVAPEQLDRFPLVVRAYRASPGAARRAHRGGDQPTATGPVLAGETTAALTLAVGVEIARALAADQQPGGRWRRWVWPRRSAGPDTAIRPLAEPDIAALQARARTFCLNRNVSEDTAAEVSAAFAAALPRATKG